MAGRPQQLNSSRGGINRLRNKGGASKENLYDLVNGYVDASGAVRSRPGTVRAYALPTGTKGLTAFNGALVVFSHQTVSNMPAGVTCEVLVHPTSPSQSIKEIHYADPFLGYLYVVAEFNDGLVRHYWLRQASTWTANTRYKTGDLVQPSTPNGYVYRARRMSPPGVAWAPDVKRAVNDKAEPKTHNGFEYVCTTVIGTNPRSGTTEPTWPTQEGATVVEDVNDAMQPKPAPSTDPPVTDPGTGIGGRYWGNDHYWGRLKQK